MKARMFLKPIILAVLTLALAGAIAPQAYAVLDPYYIPNYGDPYVTPPVIDGTLTGNIIEAENFNKDRITTRQPQIYTNNPGNNWTGYFGGDDSTEWGNDGDYHGRSDDATIDIDIWNGGGSTGRYIRCEGVINQQPDTHLVGQGGEWVNYKFNVTVADWYRIDFYAKAINFDGCIWDIVIDDLKVCDVVNTFWDVFTLQPGPTVYLTEGYHNIKVHMVSAEVDGFCLDYIQFNPDITPPTSLPAARLKPDQSCCHSLIPIS